jgi:hypothetical protein
MVVSFSSFENEFFGEDFFLSENHHSKYETRPRPLARTVTLKEMLGEPDARCAIVRDLALI